MNLHSTGQLIQPRREPNAAPRTTDGAEEFIDKTTVLDFQTFSATFTVAKNAASTYLLDLPPQLLVFLYPMPSPAPIIQRPAGSLLIPAPVYGQYSCLPQLPLCYSIDGLAVSISCFNIVLLTQPSHRLFT